MTDTFRAAMNWAAMRTELVTDAYTRDEPHHPNTLAVLGALMDAAEQLPPEGRDQVVAAALDAWERAGGAWGQAPGSVK